MRYAFKVLSRQIPTIAPNGIVNGASFDSPIAPGSYITIGGSNLTDLTARATGAILPLALDLASVSFDVPSAGISVPGHLAYASPTQINLQAPWELQGQTSAQVKVNIEYPEATLVSGILNGNVVTVAVADYAPGLFANNGVVAALDATSQPLTSANPARAGQTIELFANGLGPVTNQPASGDPAPYSPLAETKATPLVLIGGLPAQVSFSGLAPGFAGLYQVNVVAPAGLTPGIQPVTIAIGGKTSKASTILIQ